jgi:glycerol-3-phosphate cytidylyltransferase-like family protein
MTDAELDAKYSAQAAHVLDERSRESVLRHCRTVDELGSIRELTRLCVPTVGATT